MVSKMELFSPLLIEDISEEPSEVRDQPQLLEELFGKKVEEPNKLKKRSSLTSSLRRPRTLTRKAYSSGFTNPTNVNLNSEGGTSSSEESEDSTGRNKRRASCPESPSNPHPPRFGTLRSTESTDDDFSSSSFSSSLSSSYSSTTSGEEHTRRMSSIFSILSSRSRKNSIEKTELAKNQKKKHEKLNENWIDAREPVLEGVTFYVKYLGSALIEKSGPNESAEATKTVLQMARKRTNTKIALTISCRGITLLDALTGQNINHISIYDIAHCSSHSPNVFSFIATNKNQINECFCFASRKRKLAQQATLTIAEAFNLAFELWQKSDPKVAEDEEAEEEEEEAVIGNSKAHSNWVNFDEGSEIVEVETLNETLSNMKLINVSPEYSSRGSRCRGNLRQRRNNNSIEEDLLICFD